MIFSVIVEKFDEDIKNVGGGGFVGIKENLVDFVWGFE